MAEARSILTKANRPRTTSHMVRRRLDAELVRRGLARSREHANQLVQQGRVQIAGMKAVKAATQVEAADALIVDTDPDEAVYVSRGAHKFVGAIDAFVPTGLVIAGRRCLDAGASTGGFTDVLLRHGAAHVVAVDVGYGQLAWPLQQDDRVTVLDRTNVRYLTSEAVGMPIDLVVADLSFISLAVVLPALVGVSGPATDLVVLVKPQFEIGKDRLGAGGVVRDPAQRAETVHKIGRRGAELGLGVVGVVASPLPGPAGNVEYFLWLRSGAPPLVAADVERAVAKGPA